MIASVIVVPAAPILLPEYAGRIEAVPGLAGRCMSLVADLAGRRVAVVFGSDRMPRSSKLPVARRVAEALVVGGVPLAESSIEVVGPESLIWTEIAWDATASDCLRLGRDLGSSDVDALLVVADGSASRSEKAPGHLHPDAAAIDDRITSALRDPDAAGLQDLMGLDPVQCAEVLAAGRAPLQVMAAAMSVSGSWQARSVEVLAPLGVLYVLADLVRVGD